MQRQRHKRQRILTWTERVKKTMFAFFDKIFQVLFKP